nr:hypothetical protein Iba_chr12cCG24680 [Ipomoea batatas]GMD69708.1 hypothetical protein Iba_chr12dCG21640 [Ipomoea batatas]GMD73723.1 hypothetical protein Iba_chr12fCG21160 [Ipomoea batatas]
MKRKIKRRTKMRKMRSFSSLHNKHRGAKEKLAEPRMLFSLKIEVDILSQCFLRVQSRD